MLSYDDYLRYVARGLIQPAPTPRPVPADLVRVKRRKAARAENKRARQSRRINRRNR